MPAALEAVAMGERNQSELRVAEFFDFQIRKLV
jgi:hypothetical protein